MGAVFAPTRFSFVRISIRDLVADGKSLVRNSGVGGGGSKSDPQFSLQKQEIEGNRKRERERERDIYIYIYMGETPTGGHILVKNLNFPQFYS